MNTNDEITVTLVHHDEYEKNVNQVACISSDALLFVKRKELALKPFELIQYPMSECSSITYESRWAVAPMIFGMLLVMLMLFIFFAISHYDIQEGTKIRVGMLIIALFFGIKLTFGAKRHRLTFIIGGKKLRWQSKPGDFKIKIKAIDRIIAFAKAKGLFKESLQKS